MVQIKKAYPLVLNDQILPHKKRREFDDQI